MSYTGALLDIDGTLVVSNDAHAQSWVEVFKEFGYEVEFDRVRPLIGMGGDRIIPMFVPGTSDKEGKGKQIVERRKELIINKYATDLVPTPGTRDLILRMQQGLKLLVASSASSEELSVLLKAAGVADLLDRDAATTSNDAQASKPEPDLLEVALERLGLPADRVVMLGDTPYDIEAAKKVGVGTIALRCGGFSDEELKDAIAIYNDPADLLADYDRSPLGTVDRDG
jgi:HAD superfamily hydrolase (TIGR01509 family)